jgi:serine protease Do
MRPCTRSTIVATGAAVALVAGVATILPAAWHSPAIAVSPTPPATSTAAAPAPSAALQTLPDFSSLVERFGPAVVNIAVKQDRRMAAHTPEPSDPDEGMPFPFGPPFFRGLPMPAPEMPMRGQGSGFIISPDGLILTNAHVVDDAKEVTVKLTDRREFQAKVVGTDRHTDVAVLRIDAKNLPAVRIGDPEALKVGQWVVAIGAPFGFENSVTAGIVSAKGRALPAETYVPFIQTDVAVNPGNSGGPLFNLNGEVVGINSQIFSRSGGYQGVSFAIPIDVAVRVQEELVANGRVSRGWLGVGIQPLSQELAESFGLKQPRGALVSQVQPDSPAEKAGVKAGDVIVDYDGHAIDQASDLPPLVGTTAVGSNAKITVLRDGREKALTAKVAQLAAAEDEGTPDTDTAGRSGLGIAVAELTEEQRDDLGIESGVVVTQVGEGPAAEAGIRRGDVLLRFGAKEVQSPEQLRELVAAAPAGKRVPVLINRGGNNLFLSVEPEARKG